MCLSSCGMTLRATRGFWELGEGGANCMLLQEGAPLPRSWFCVGAWGAGGWEAKEGRGQCCPAGPGFPATRPLPFRPSRVGLLPERLIPTPAPLLPSYLWGLKVHLLSTRRQVHLDVNEHKPEGPHLQAPGSHRELQVGGRARAQPRPALPVNCLERLPEKGTRLSISTALERSCDLFAF